MRLRLHYRYLLSILCLVATAMGAVSVALLLHYERSMAQVRQTAARAFTESLTDQFEDRARGLGLVTAEALVEPLALLDVEGVQGAIQAIKAEPDILSIFIYDSGGLAFFDDARYLFPRQDAWGSEQHGEPTAAVADRLLVYRGDGTLRVSAPIRMGAQLLGAVSIDLSTAELDAAIGGLVAEVADIDRAAKRSRTAWLAGIAGMLLVLATLSTVLVARSLSRPIELLSSLTARIGRGDEYDIEVPAARRTDELGDLARALGAMARNLQQTTVSRDNFDRILNGMHDALVVTTPAGVIQDANRAAAELVGRTTSELIGRPITELVSEGDAAALRHHDLLTTGVLESFETAVTAEGGRSTPVLLSAAAMRGGGGTVRGIVCVLHDITERTRAEAQIRHMAHHDALTGLPNRVLFQDRLRQALAQARRGGHAVALLLLDLDRFKDINDTLGHATGDRVLTAVARRIESALRETDTVARLGGDEFAVIQTGARQFRDAEALCRRLVDAITPPLHLDGHDLFVGVSIGIAAYPAHGEEPDRLLKNADMALYEAKARGRCTFRFFEGGMDIQLRERRGLERDLRRALERGELALHYQPRFDLPNRGLTAVEALLRWLHPEHGRIPPDTFIPLAERTGLIMPLGEWVLRTACAQAAAWLAEGDGRGTELRVAVNLSPAQFHHHDLAGLVRAILRDAGLPPHLLELEITEGILMHYTEANLTTLQRLRDQGVRISMDDFGTGYSSLGYLRRFPFDAIKIDRSFVRDLGHDPEAAAVVRAALTLGDGLGMACVAEGVETAAQLALLEEQGCREAQGYYFGAPVPAAEIGRMLARRPYRIAAAV
ncbi:MAG TPA: EAL domain-containing protein [Geminicoccaceae bacterium]|nr:EAL domain-containing protein [Geminicoccaceae bacterium]